MLLVEQAGADLGERLENTLQDLGPGADDATVFIGMDHEGGTEVREFRFDGSREEIKEKASQKGLEILMDYLIEMGNKASKKTKL